MSGTSTVADGVRRGGDTGVERLVRPRLGFLGVGWIGRHRMQCIAEGGDAELSAVAEPVAELRALAAEVAPQARLCSSFEQLLEEDLDGVVIATPSALHAEQSIRALEAGLAVFCQKPLARTAKETARVLDAARRADRLLGVDFSYRFVDGIRRIHELVGGGQLGRVFAIDLVFHNAYGPDKPWFFDPALSGGGCVIDLGIHLVDLALWMQGFPDVEQVSSRCLAKGELIRGREVVEDYAIARLDLADGSTVQLACSWNLPAGQDAVIEATFYGTKGGATLYNVGGSFYDFVAERLTGTSRERLAEPPDAWGGRAAADWAARLARNPHYDPTIEQARAVAEVIDSIYRNSR